jgi:hypothetical protein
LAVEFLSETQSIWLIASKVGEWEGSISLDLTLGRSYSSGIIAFYDVTIASRRLIHSCSSQIHIALDGF